MKLYNTLNDKEQIQNLNVKVNIFVKPYSSKIDKFIY